MLKKPWWIMTGIICALIINGCTITKILPPPQLTPAVKKENLSPRPKLALLSDKEFQEVPITVHGKIQEYEIAVEGRFDEDENAIDILGEQMRPAPTAEEKKVKSWWQFWK